MRTHWLRNWISLLLFTIVTPTSMAATISTIAGNPVPNGTATNVGSGNYGVAVDASGDIYVADASNHAVRKINHTTGISTVIAGIGSSGSTGDGGAATSAKLNAPRGVAVDSSGNVYIADTNNHRIRKIDTSGNISTFAGIGLSGSTGDSGAATSARINFPQSVAIDSSGNIYIADTSNHRIRQVDTSGIISTFAGTGTAGSTGDGGAATSARLNNPRGIVIDGSTFYIADTSNHRIRKIASGTITTFAGSSAGLSGDNGAASSAQLSGPQAITMDSTGNLYIADTGNSRIRKIDTSGTITTIAGTSSGFSGDTGLATSAQLASPAGVGIDSSGIIYIGDTNNNRLRKIATDGTITTFAGTGVTTYGGDGGVATSAQFSTPQGVAVDSAGNVYMADSGHHRIRKIDTSGNISTYAGTGTAGFTGDGGPATSARLNTPLGISIDSSDNLYIAEGNNSRIRKVATDGTITTVAGSSAGFSGDGGAATSAQINSPFGVVAGSGGVFYIADTGNQRIRKVDGSGNITTVAGTGSAGSSGDTGAATSAQINTPMSGAIDSSGNYYFADYGNSKIRKVDTGGTITTVAGTGISGFSGDNGAATSAQLNSPRSVAVDSTGNVYIADTSNSVIRKVDTSGTITSIAGTGGSSGFSGDGGVATSAQLSSPQGVAVNSSGTVYIGDTSNRRIRRVMSVVVPGAPTIGTATAGSSQATVTFTAPASDGGATITGYTATSSPGGITGTGASSPITVTGLTNGTAYTFTVTATNSAGTGSASAASNSVTPKASQTITFANPGAQNFGTTPTLTATSDSGLTVSFTSSTTGVCTITSGGALTFVTTGTCTIDADQAGNGSYQAASTISRSFSINAVVPGTPTIGTATAGNTQVSVTFSAPASNGGASITGYTATSSPGGITGTGASSPITVTGLTNGTAYTFTVTATNSAGTGSASAASNSVTPKASQTITFANPGTQNFGTTPTLTATSDSGLTVSFTSSTSGVCTITSGGALTFVTTGTCTIDADQAGNGSYQAATTVSRSFSINAVAPGAPTIGTATAGNAQATVTFTAPASNGGATITGYTATSSPGGLTSSGCTSSPCTVTGLTNGTAYTFTVTATNSVGTSTASSASNSVTPKASQTITFANPGAQNYGTTPTLTATSDSGLTVSFTSSTTGVCTITSGGVLSLITPGTCTIDADQAGNGSYQAASTVSRSFSINAVVPGAPTIGTPVAGNTQVSVAFTAPASNGGSAITGYTVTSSPGGITGTGTSSPITVTGLTNGTAYSFTVTATNAVGTGSPSGSTSNVTPATVPGAPTIGSATTGNTQATVSFTAPGSNGGSAITGYTATSSPGGITGTGASSPITVTGLTNGTAYTFTVTATNIVGTGSASSASNSVTPATVPGAPAIGIATAGDAQASISFAAPVSNGGSVITGYTMTSSPGAFTGTGTSSPITVTGLTNGTAYTFTVTATNSAGTGSASAASNSVTPKASQTITFANPGAQNFSTTPTLTATSDSGLTVSFTSSTTGVCTITSGGALSLITTGTCTIDADQAGNGSYQAATTVSRSFSINAVVPGAPTIGTATAGNTQVSVTFSAPASNGGASITGYTVTSSPGGITGTGASSPITVTSLTNGTAYTFTVTATNSAGTGSASSASNSVTPKASQTITFANPGAQNFGTTPTLTATSDSGLTVSFTSSTTGVCTITSGGVLSLITPGTCTIDADQAGNGSYQAASTVSRSFSINAVVPGAPTIGTATAGNAQVSVTFTAPASNGGATITGYTMTSSPGAFTGTGTSSPITVAGLTNGTAYTFTVTATNSAGTGSASSASNSVTPKGTQTITFTNPGAQNYGTTPTLTATSDSGLTVSFTSSTTGVCTITTGGALTLVTTGTCTIDADQAGNGSYQAATTVSRSFSINAVVPGAPTIGTATAGNAQASISFSAPASNGGATITGYTLTSSPGALTGTGTSSPITVTGLTNGTAYTFTVTATNSAGTGSASAASNSVTPATVPGAPVIGTPVAGNTQVSVAFTAPASNGGSAITGYTATSSPGGITGTGASSPITVTGLTNGTAYSFTVTATNAVGTGSPSGSTSNVTPATVPGAPTIGSATTGNTQATISFTAPASNGGMTITGYTVTSSPGGITGTGASSPITVMGLTNGTAYTFTVTATNIVGTGSASSASNSVTPATVPGAPAIGIATAGDAQASISFAAPASNGGSAITGYTLTSSPGAFTGTGASSPITVIGLTNGMAYTFTVTATNSAGTGSASSASNSVTPRGSQTITFTNPGAQNFGGTTPTLTATSDSGLTVSFTSSTTGVCTITSGGVLSLITTGTCTIDADQAGNGSYQAASTVSRSFSINAVVPDAPTIGTATAGKAQATVSFIAPGFTGGAPITGYTVTATPDGVTATGASSPLTVTGLTNGTAYTFTVVATNSAGNSAASSPSNSVIPFRGPELTAPEDVTVDAVGLFTPVDIGTATAVGGAIPVVTQVNDQSVMTTPTHFRPGINTVTWSATDEAGHTETAVQHVNVTPRVDFNKSQVSAEGSTATFKVILNGPAVSYPVIVPYSVGGTALIDGSDHDLMEGSVTIHSPDLEATVNVHFVNDGAGEGTENLVITMGTPVNAVAGQVKTHTIEIDEGNVAPAVMLSGTQGSGVTRIIGQGNGVVTVTAAVTDPNVGDVHNYRWSGTDNALIDIDAVTNTFTFDPASLLPGLYHLKVEVSDGTASGNAELLLKVEAALPALTAVDSDGDGVNDDVEGAGDSDSDGIPNYLDDLNVTRNVLQEKQVTATQYLIETEPGLFINLGQIALRAGHYKAGVTNTEIQNYANHGAGAPQDAGQTFSGGLFDFEVSELPVAGQQVKVVLAQFAAIPADAVYRKLMPGGWQDFVIDADNNVASAAGAEGFCPPPGDSAYTAGLTEGHWCVQLTLQDGGPNDADGVADQHVQDPGGVGAKLPVTVVIAGSGGSGVMSPGLVLLLGAALLMRSGRRRFLMLTLTLIGSNAQAETSFMPDYAGLSYLGVNSDERSGDFEADLNALGLTADVTQTNLSRRGWSFHLGYRIDDRAAIELGYVDLGTVTTTISGATTDVNSYLATASAVHPVTASGWTCTIAMRERVYEDVAALFKFGILRWQADYTLASATASRKFSDTGISAALGGGLEKMIAPDLSLQLGWNIYRLDGANVSAWEVGIGYRF